jgi:hypothetical protein
MSAVLGGHKAIAKELLVKGANPDLLSKENMRARDMAEENGLSDMCELLKSFSARADATEKEIRREPTLIIKGFESTLDGVKTPPGSIRAWELRTALGHFLDMLSECSRFKQIDTLDDENVKGNAFFVNLTIRESEDRKEGANATKAFLSGFFTLGLIAPSADYGYISAVTLLVERADGKKKEYNARSDTTATWRGDPRTADYIKKSKGAGESARKLVTHQAFESLISQLETDHFFGEQ